jgi:hypothetical protein
MILIPVSHGNSRGPGNQPTSDKGKPLFVDVTSGSFVVSDCYVLLEYLGRPTSDAYQPSAALADPEMNLKRQYKPHKPATAFELASFENPETGKKERMRLQSHFYTNPSV